MQLLVFHLGPMRLGLPLLVVERVEPVCEITPLPGAPSAVLGAINLQGRLAVVVDLHPRLGLATRDLALGDSFVVVRLPRHLYVLPVDDVEGVVEVDADAIVPAEGIVDGLSQVRGLVRTREGLLLIEDPERFLDLQDLRLLDAALDAVTGESHGA